MRLESLEDRGLPEIGSDVLDIELSINVAGCNSPTSPLLADNELSNNQSKRSYQLHRQIARYPIDELPNTFIASGNSLSDYGHRGKPRQQA